MAQVSRIVALLLLTKKKSQQFGNSVVLTPYIEQLFTFVSEANAPHTKLSPVKLH